MPKFYVLASDDLVIHDCVDAVAGTSLPTLLAEADQTGEVVYELVRVKRPVELARGRARL